jgi:hypothetical protein
VIRRTQAAAAALLAALLAALPGTSRGSVFPETSVEEVARASDAVVRGRVERRASLASRDGRTFRTEVEVTVSSAWKGTPGPRVRVVVPGGAVNGLVQRVDGAPTFAEGEEVVLFLSRRGDFWQVSGLALGKYRVAADRAVPDLSGVVLAPAAVAAGERAVAEMSLLELRARVDAAGAAR